MIYWFRVLSIHWELENSHYKSWKSKSGSSKTSFIVLSYESTCLLQVRLPVWFQKVKLSILLKELARNLRVGSSVICLENDVSVFLREKARNLAKGWYASFKKNQPFVHLREPAHFQQVSSPTCYAKIACHANLACHARVGSSSMSQLFQFRLAF